MRSHQHKAAFLAHYPLAVLPSGAVDCSHWLDRTATPRQEARNLFAQVEKNGVTVESIRELIAVPPKIEQALRQYVRRHPEDAEAIEKVLSFRKRVREEFDRLARKSENPSPLMLGRLTSEVQGTWTSQK